MLQSHWVIFLLPLGSTPAWGFFVYLFVWNFFFLFSLTRVERTNHHNNLMRPISSSMSSADEAKYEIDFWLRGSSKWEHPFSLVLHTDGVGLKDNGFDALKRLLHEGPRNFGATSR